VRESDDLPQLIEPPEGERVREHAGHWDM
jgi:hypothetical protein